MKIASYNVLKNENVSELLNYLGETKLGLETFNEARNAIIVKKIKFMMDNHYTITLQEVDQALLAKLKLLIVSVSGYNCFDLGTLVIIGKNLTKIDHDKLLICESEGDNYTVMTYLSNGNDNEVIQKVNEIKNKKPTFFTSNMKENTSIELKLLNNNGVKTSYTSNGFGNTDGIWGPDNFFVKEDNTDFPHYNGSKQNHYDIEELIKDSVDVDKSKKILMTYNFPGPNLMTQPSDHLCVKLEIEEIDTEKVALKLGSYDSKDSTKKIGSYNMSFASISDLVKYNTGHIASEATFLAKKEGPEKYSNNAYNLLKEFMKMKPLAVGLQEMLQYKFQDSNVDDSGSNKIVKSENDSIILTVQYKNGDTDILTTNKILFNSNNKDINNDVICVADAFVNEKIITANPYLEKIIDDNKIYNVICGTVFMEGLKIGESAVILSNKTLGDIQNPKIYNIGNNTPTKQINDARPLLIAHTSKNYILICVHAPNKPSKYGEVKEKLDFCISHYTQTLKSIEDIYIMGDFNDAFNQLKDFTIKINGSTYTPKYKNAPRSCCYNWNSSGFNLSHVAEPRDADITMRRKEFLFENEDFYLKILDKVLNDTEKKKLTDQNKTLKDYPFLNGTFTHNNLFGMPLMREQGNLLNYLFTGDYCFSNNNVNSVKIYRKIDHLDKFFKYPDGIKDYEKFNFLLHVYQSNPDLRKKIYYLCSIESTESDHEMVYLDVDLTPAEIIRQRVEARKAAKPANASAKIANKVPGTSMGGYTKKRKLKTRNKRMRHTRR